MRDVNNGWLIRYLHSNTASAFFFIVYLHIGRGMYYGSYRAPRTLVWTIGTVIFILMMAKDKWPNWMLISHNKSIQDNLSSYFSKSRTKAIYRIGPHNKEVLSIIICGMVGDWWADLIKAQISPNVRFSIEQGINNAAYIHILTLYLNKLGYCSNITPHLVKKSDKDNARELEDRFNYRLTLYSFTSLLWIYHSFYKDVNGKKIKVIPSWIGDYITPIGLAHLVMQIGCLKSEGLILCTKFNDINDLNFLKNVLIDKYGIDTTIVSHSGKREICIKVESIPLLRSIIHPYIYPELSYLLDSNHLNTIGGYINSNDKIEIVATYDNADVNKELAVKENRAKSGIYRWINKETGKSYVGSSANLSKRFNQYYNYNHIADTKRNMRIDRALLKYGYSKFKLEILEYCEISNLIEREQYYLDILKPEYNILLRAGSSLGFKHSEKTKLYMKTKTPEHLVKIKNNIAKLNASPFPADVRAKITAAMIKFNVLTKSKKVVFTNIETND